MTKTFTLPEDPLARFHEIHDALNAERRWWQGASTLRFAAITAMTCPGNGHSVATEIRRISERIKEESGWFGSLNSDLCFIVAVMLLQQGDTAVGFLNEVKRVREMFRELSLRRDGVFETMAILVMRISAELKPVQKATVRRFQSIYEEMKRHHWWLTGPDDFPACAILACRSESPLEIGAAIERIYQALRAKGFKAGDPLQTAANLLYLANEQPREIAMRYRDLADGFEHANVSMWQSDYDELAILSFLGHPARVVVDRVVQHREVMKSLRPRPDRSLTFNLASSVAFLDLVKVDSDLKSITDAKALMDMQAIIQAQQAAAAAAASSAAAASAASSG